MPIFNLEIILCERLNCGVCDQVILQLNDPSLLLANQGAPADEIVSFVRGEIVSFEEVIFNCQNCWRYIISYDDAVLLDPLAPLQDCDIRRICCVDCILDYIDELDYDHTISSSDCGLLRLTRPDGTFDDITIETCTNLPIFGDGTAANPIDLLLSTDADNIATLGSDSGLYVSAHIVETITTLVDNGDTSFTYTSEDATVTNFDAAHTLSEPVANTIRLTRPDGSFDEVVVATNETITTLVDNADNTYTYTSEDATVTVINTEHSLSEPVANTIRLTKPDGTFDDVAVSFAETVTTLVDNGNNTFTYTNEAAAPVLVSYGHGLTKPSGKVIRLTAPSGSFNDVPLTDTTTIQSNGMPGGSPVPFTLSSSASFTSTVITQVVNAPADRGIICDSEISFRPSFIYDSRTGAAEIVEFTQIIEVQLDGGGWNAITTQQLQYDLGAGNFIQRPELHNERQFYSIAAGGSLTIEARFRIVCAVGSAGINSRLDNINGSISSICSTT